MGESLDRRRDMAGHFGVNCSLAINTRHHADVTEHNHTHAPFPCAAQSQVLVFGLQTHAAVLDVTYRYVAASIDSVVASMSMKVTLSEGTLGACRRRGLPNEMEKKTKKTKGHEN